MTTVKEGSTAYLTVTFLNAEGAEEAPVSATWQIDDVASGTALLPATTIDPIAASVELTLTPALNAIVNDLLAYEKRRITVKATYGAADKVNRAYTYDVQNLSAVT